MTAAMLVLEPIFEADLPRPSALSRPVAGDAMATATHPAMRGSHSAISGNTMTRMSAMS